MGIKNVLISQEHYEDSIVIHVKLLTVHGRPIDSEKMLAIITALTISTRLGWSLKSLLSDLQDAAGFLSFV